MIQAPDSMNTQTVFGFVSMPGGGEWMLLFIVALLLFGAKKLPELARGLGKAMAEFKSAQREFQDEIRRAEYAVREEPRKLPMGGNNAAVTEDTTSRSDA
jgi:sec-independent protein translocase protein TatA